MDSTDIFIITADANQLHRYADTGIPKPNKVDLIRNNIPLVRSIASHFDSDYDGTVIIKILPWASPAKRLRLVSS